MTKIRVSVYRRGDVKDRAWAINYRLPGGKRIRRTVSHRKDLAQVIARQLEVELNRGNLEPEIMTVRQCVSEFMASVAHRAKKTVAAYRHTSARFCDRYGTLKLMDIVPAHIMEFMRQRPHIAPATRAKHLRELSVMFNTAVTWGYILKSPCKGVRAPRVPRNPPRVLEKRQVRELLESVRGTPYYALLATAAFAGLRREELVWLDWDDVDCERRQLYLRNKPEHPLKDYEARTVPIPTPLVEILEGLRREQGRLAEDKAQPVFRSPKGFRWAPMNLSHRATPIFRKAGIEGALHTLRHAYASHLVMAGVDLASVQKLLGHSSITTTMIYAHVAQEHLKAEVEKLRY